MDAAHSIWTPGLWTQPLPPLGQWPQKLAGCLGLQPAHPPSPLAARPGAAQQRRRRRAAALEPVGADEWPRACGWHASSHELHNGLQVQELSLEEAPAHLEHLSLLRL